MNHPRTVLVLTPILGGFYFGELLASLTRAISSAGARLVIVKTLHQAPSDDSQAPGNFAIPVAWSQVDGVVSIHSAVEAPFLLKLRESGRPVVLLGGMTAGIDAPGVMPDNRTGTIAAVEHLIGHGHTRIGFVGNLSHGDIRDRFNAYQEALVAHGLECDPAAVFNASDNMDAGGTVAALDFLMSDSRPTAVMVGTDRNALGLMAVLKEAGMVLPDDLAIVAFDNIESSSFAVPSLTSTSQRFDDLGSLAGHLILSAIEGVHVPHEVFTPKAVTLKVRNSCGCADGETISAHPVPERSSEIARRHSDGVIAEDLLDALSAADTVLNGATRDAGVATIAAVDRLLAPDHSITDADVRGLVLSLGRLTSRPDALHLVIDDVLDHIEHAAPAGAGAASVARLTVELWKVKAGEYLRHLQDKELAFIEQYVVDAGMLDSHRTKPHSLEWLAGTHVKAGALALWAPASARNAVEIVGTYSAGRALPTLVGTQAPVENFPPADLLDLLDAEDRDICVVVPVRTATRDWGMLAMVGPVESAAMRETYRHWAGMLGAALESQRLQEEVRKSALYDALTGLPNRRLFLERLTAAVNRRVRSGTPYAVLFLDLDGFKLINDSLGHQMGDRVLAEVGERIGREVRTVDTGSRFGGDEFAVLLEDTDDEGALLVAQRIQTALNAPIDLDGSAVAVGASLGIATSGLNYTSGEEILRDADIAMYKAKAKDTGAIEFFHRADPA